MKRHVTTLIVAASLAALPLTSQAQQGRQAIANSAILSQISMFNYREGPKSDILFRGTPLAATAEGKGQVEYEDGNARIEVDVEDLPNASLLGPYTTYVLWALTPDGRAINQGVVVPYGEDKGKLETRYGASQFTLIITAEPHFAVTVPSNMIILYNVADDVKGQETKIQTLVEQADYSDLSPIAISEDMPPEIVQARYSLAIASAAGADQYAPDAYAAARQELAAAEAALTADSRSDRRNAPNLAREAVVGGEDARRAAMAGSAAAAAEAERQAAAAAAAEAERRQGEAAAAAAAAAAAEAAAAEARADLRNRLNAALPTRETDRGLVSEIGGVQFATGSPQLNDSARESLARFAGIVASYPTLEFSVEGHTDSTGSAATNNELSLQRAMSVRDYLTSQGIASSRIDVAGFGSMRPVADNSTSQGRARNRRVEIVLSGSPLTTD